MKYRLKFRKKPKETEFFTNNKKKVAMKYQEIELTQKRTFVGNKNQD